jgi:hypothetical protein
MKQNSVQKIPHISGEFFKKFPEMPEEDEKKDMRVGLIREPARQGTRRGGERRL